MKNNSLVFTKKTDNDIEFINDVLKILEGLPKGMYQMKVGKPVRTSRQNRAMHLFFQHLSDALNEAGVLWGGAFIERFFKDGFETKWTPKLVKTNLWGVLQVAMFGKTSTASLTTSELTKIAEYLQSNFARNGIDVAFPSIEDMIHG